MTGSPLFQIGAFIVVAAVLVLGLGWLVGHWLEWRQTHHRMRRRNGFEDMRQSVRKAEREQHRRSG